MGKNRKLKNAEKQDVSCNGSEDKNQEAPIDFLTSDDFCVVQKKRGNKKSPDIQQDSPHFPRSRSNSIKNAVSLSDTDSLSDDNEVVTCGSFNYFWSRKCQELSSNNSSKESNADQREKENSNENKNIVEFPNDEILSTVSKKTVKTKNSENSIFFQSEQVDVSTFGDASEVDYVLPNQSFDPESGKAFLNFAASGSKFQILDDVEFFDDEGSLEHSEEDDEITSSENKTEMDSCDISKSKNSNRKSSRKNKRKELKKKQFDDELEKLLKELDSHSRKNSSEKIFLNQDVQGEEENVVETDTCLSNKIIQNGVSEIAEVINISPKKDVNTSDAKEDSQVSVLYNDKDNAEDSGVDGLGDGCMKGDKVVQNDNLLSGDHTVKTAAQKKKEKKAREKQKRLEKYEIESSRKKSEPSEMQATASRKQELIGNDVNEAIAENEEIKRNKKKDESEKKDKKRPGKKQLAVIQEALRKAKEEEERLKKEEEARQKAAEEAERLRLEKIRLEQEKKERKKLKEKLRREKLKAEGKLLTKSQKQSRARMEATLAALREQGINIPQIGEKRPSGPRLGNSKTFYRKRLDSNQSTQSCDSLVTSERQKSESLSSQESSGKESFADLPSSFDSKDSWDMSSVEGSAVTAESENGQLSCSEESDILDENSTADSQITKDVLSVNLQNIRKLSATKTNSSSVEESKFLISERKEDSVKLRSPVVCVLGHVDTGKTKILDFIRKTHVQDSEAGGITQQIGATMIPQDALKEKCKMVKDFSSFEMKVPGLLVIDTPGHESFSNLRSRGSSICDIAVLVVDIMHGLEPQTIESINLLKKGKTPFVVALNKVDRIYQWKSTKDTDIENIIKNQSPVTQIEFKKRCQDVILQFANECLNTTLFFENSDPRSYVSMVPTSAITGDGMGNILALVTQLTQSLMHKKLIFSDELQATVLEVKAISGLGTTIDVILVNGRLHEGDTIVLAGNDGPIVTQIRSLLMPQPLKELRVKNPYIEYKTVEGAQGVKITGKDLDKAIAGLPLLVAQNTSKVDTLKEEINHLFRERMNAIKTSERGVYVQASTLGSLEALLEFLNSSNIPYFNVKIGPVVKKDVMKASIMLEHDNQYAVILAFDVKVERDAQELADSLGVHIFHADIIYHLFDMYMKYRDDLLMKKREEIKRFAVFPCKLKILPQFVFNARDPIVLGVSVEAGTLREGTPLCVPSRDILEIGTVSTIEVNHKHVDCAKKGQEVCVKIDPKQGDTPKMYGRHFDHEDILVSRISRQSIDVCKEHYRDELQPSDWHLIVELKKLLHIV